MRTPASIKVVNWVEADYGSSRPKMTPDLRGDERALDMTFLQGKSREIRVHVAENNAARTAYSLYLLLPPDERLGRREVDRFEVDLMLTRGEMLALPSILHSAVREADKIGMFDRGPSLWARREIDKGRAS